MTANNTTATVIQTATRGKQPDLRIEFKPLGKGVVANIIDAESGASMVLAYGQDDLTAKVIARRRLRKLAAAVSDLIEI